MLRVSNYTHPHGYRSDRIVSTAFTGYLTNLSVNGVIAQKHHGATIVLEHRYYGESNPFRNLSTESLRFHTIQQAVNDFEFFAKTVNLPMPGGDAVKPDHAPWVLVGGSYAGALVGWTMVAYAVTFSYLVLNANAAGSSQETERVCRWLYFVSRRRSYYVSIQRAPVQQCLALTPKHSDFWAFFEPIRQNMPPNCSADIQAVIAHVDYVFTSGKQPQIDSVKANFGLQNLTHLDDVAGARESCLHSSSKFEKYNCSRVVRRILPSWQELSPNMGTEGGFFKFCDALEVQNGTIAPASGFGLTHALTAWGNFWKNGYLAEGK